MTVLNLKPIVGHNQAIDVNKANCRDCLETNNNYNVTSQEQVEKSVKYVVRLVCTLVKDVNLIEDLENGSLACECCDASAKLPE